jgi:hydroxymethylpyrimidine/phosphomethylpyrimidine kinase
MSEQNRLAIALTIAGSDSGGGAGIQADLKTFAALGVHGASAITCVTAQNPKRVLGIEPCRPETVRLQLQAVFDELPPAAAKTGMLHSAVIIRVVAAFFKNRPQTPLVVDPVMISTSGARLIEERAVKVLRDELLPIAALVTPNVDEAAALIGRKLRSVEELRFAAREIHRRFGCAALVKGGHLRGLREAADIFFDGRTELLLTAPFVKGIRTHGTGCVYSAAITAHLAQGLELPAAVAHAKEFITAAIAGSRTAGGHWVLNTDCAEAKR